MTYFALFAFLAPPAILFAIGYAAVLLQEHATRQEQAQVRDPQGSLHLTA